MTHWVENRATGWHLCLGVQGCGAHELQPGLFPADKATIRQFQEVRTLMENPGRFASQRLDLLTGLIILHLREQLGDMGATLSPALRVKERIDASFAEPWDVEKLAQSVFLSPDYLRQVFRKEFGESVHRYLTRRRMEYAIHQLLTTSETVQKIGQACGFPDVYYFSRVFKKWTGIAPADFRLQQIAQKSASDER